MYGYGFLARQLIQKRRLLLVESRGRQFYNVRFELLYTLKLLLGNTELVVITEPLYLPEIPTHGECVVVIFEHDMLSVRDFMCLVEHPNCMVLYIPYSLSNVGSFYLNQFPCFLWYVVEYADVLYMAQRYRVVQHLVTQNRQCLPPWQEGLLFGSDTDNVCCYIDLGPRTNYAQFITQAQDSFRHRKHCATLIQRAVKQWLYRPGAGLGQHVVSCLQARLQHQ